MQSLYAVEYAQSNQEGHWIFFVVGRIISSTIYLYSDFLFPYLIFLG